MFRLQLQITALALCFVTTPAPAKSSLRHFDVPPQGTSAEYDCVNGSKRKYILKELKPNLESKDPSSNVIFHRVMYSGDKIAEEVTGLKWQYFSQTFEKRTFQDENFTGKITSGDLHEVYHLRFNKILHGTFETLGDGKKTISDISIALINYVPTKFKEKTYRTFHIKETKRESGEVPPKESTLESFYSPDLGVPIRFVYDSGPGYRRDCTLVELNKGPE